MARKVLILIFAIAFVLRLAGLSMGYWYNPDTARDILVARAALAKDQIPLVGSFSSAGPFVFGPQWYWFLMLVNFLFPKQEIMVAIAVILMSLGTMALLVSTAAKIAGQKFAVITAIFFAISPYLINSSWTVSQHGLTTFFSALALFAVVSLYQHGSPWYGILAGLSFGTAVSLHLQALTLGVLFLPIIFVLWRNWRRLLLVVFSILIGTAIGLAVYVYWDSLVNFANVKAILDYFLIGQYRFYVPNRWLSYVFNFLPGIFGDFLGAGATIGLVTLVLIGFAVIAGFLKKNIPFAIKAIVFALVFDFILFRFYHGPRLRGYFLFLDPQLSLILAWLIFSLSKVKWILAPAILLVVAFISLSRLNVTVSQSNAGAGLFKMRADLEARYPSEKFTVYTSDRAANAGAFNLSLVLDDSNLSSPEGHPLLVCLAYTDICSQSKAVISESSMVGQPYKLLDLAKEPGFQPGSQWHNFDKTAVYNEVELWWLKGRT